MIRSTASAVDVRDVVTECLSKASSILSLALADDGITRMSDDVQLSTCWAVQSLIEEAQRFSEYGWNKVQEDKRNGQ
jgi:hypothetical protein